MLHSGRFLGNEFSMVGNFKILDFAATLIDSGDAVPMIIVFTSMYTNPNKENCDGITADEEPFYDAFLEDLTEYLMPCIAGNYPIKTGRENTYCCFRSRSRSISS